MKKWFLFCLALLLAGAAWADNDKVIDFNELPEKAQQLVLTHFDRGQVVLVKQEREWFGSLYEVKFADGCELEFLGNGEWKQIDCGRRAVPDALVPAQILRQVKSRFEGRRIVKIERDRREYEVELDDDTDLTFDSNFNIVDIDR